MHRSFYSKEDTCISTVIQAALTFLLDFLTTSVLELESLHLGQTQRALLLLEVFGVWLGTLGFIIICSNSYLHFFHRGLNRIFNNKQLINSIYRHLHGADSKRTLLDSLHRSSRHLLRHITSEGLDFFVYRPIHWIGPLLSVLVHKSVKSWLRLHLLSGNLNLIGSPIFNGSLIHLN